jgi:hypothetical protein
MGELYSKQGKNTETEVLFATGARRKKTDTWS